MGDSKTGFTAQALLGLVGLLGLLALAGCPAQETTTTQGTTSTTAAETVEAQMERIHGLIPAEATGAANPVAADAASVARGKDLYARNCALCHGEKGDGKGPSGAAFTPKPSDFTTTHMKDEATDGDLFWVIQNGTKTAAGSPTPMVGWKGRLSEHETWDVVNYIRATFIGTAETPAEGEHM